MPRRVIIYAYDVDAWCHTATPKSQDREDASGLEAFGKSVWQFGRSNHNPIGRVLLQKLNRTLGIGFIGQIDEQWAQTSIQKAPCDKVEDLQKHRVMKVIQDQPDHAGLSCGRAAG